MTILTSAMKFKKLLLIESFVCLMVFSEKILCNEQCGGFNVCPRNKPFCSKAGCVFECQQPFYVNGTYCVSTCGDWFVKNQLCVRHCPDKWFIRETLELIGSQVYLEKHCISSCSTTEYMFEDTCVRACPLNFKFINNQVCSSQCAGDKHLLQNFSINAVTYHECVGQCPQFVDGIYCTEECGTNKFVLNSTCVDKCPDSHPLTSGNDCVQKCPDTTVYLENNTCLTNCTEEKPFYRNKTCTETCPETFYITNRSGVMFCEYMCQGGEYTYKNTCLHSCADDGKRNYYLFYYHQTCLEECPANYFSKKNEYYLVGKCVASCAKDEFINNNTCVENCPVDTFVINSSCVNKCPAKFPINCLAEKGEKCNGDGPRPHTLSQKLCVSSCPKNTFIFSNACVKECPISYRVSEQECVSECPKDFPLVQNKTISYKTWIRCYYCLSGWETTTQTDHILECVSECREGTVNFNSTCVYECPYNYRYIENGTCQMNACTKQYMYNDSSNIICTDSCGDEYFIYNNTCVKECPNNVYITNKTCHLDTCKTTYMYNTSSVIICTDDCIKYGFIHDKACATKCPYYVFNGACVLNCPESHALMVNQTRKIHCDYEQKNCNKTISYTECKNKCLQPLYKHKDLCLDVCPKSHFVFDQTCVAMCPQSHPFHQQMNVKGNKTNSPDGKDQQLLSQDVKYFNVCVVQCTYPRYLLDKATYSCLDTCPNTTRYIHSNVCTTGCPKGKLSNEIKKGTECIDNCPSKKLLFNKTCIQACPQNTYNYNNSKCVFKCPDSQPLGLTSGKWRCIRSCESYELFKNGKCISESDCEEPYFAFENTCVNTCPEGYIWVNGCGKRWSQTETIVTVVTLSIFIILAFWCRVTLKEYFIVLSMIIIKADVYCNMNSDESVVAEYDNQNEDEQPLLIELDEHEET